MTNLSTAPSLDFAPVDGTVFDDRLANGRIATADPERYFDFSTPGRFRETRGAEVREGDYAYTRSRREGFVRVINHSAEPGAVRIQAVDDDGVAHGPLTLSLPAHGTRHFNSGDLEQGKCAVFVRQKVCNLRSPLTWSAEPRGARRAGRPRQRAVAVAAVRHAETCGRCAGKGCPARALRDQEAVACCLAGAGWGKPVSAVASATSSNRRRRAPGSYSSSRQ